MLKFTILETEEIHWIQQIIFSPISLISLRVNNYFTTFSSLAIAMIVCFFSLKSSMFNSIYSQSKEISILRAMGVSKFWLYRVYIYEAFIIVLSSSLLGIMIGTFVGYTMVIQVRQSCCVH